MQCVDYASSNARNQMHMSRCSTYNDESYLLLLELSTQEPTMQTCMKIAQSTCLAQGIHVRIKGKECSKSFQNFIDRYYIPFAEEAIRHFFTLGFVPWRLRKIASGDCVPETIPMGLFTWRIDSSPAMSRYNIRDMKGRQSMIQTSEQMQAQLAFEKQKSIFSLSGEAQQNHSKKQKRGDFDGSNFSETVTNTAAYTRQQHSMQRFTNLIHGGKQPDDDESSKMLRYKIQFTENCGLLENEVEIYEYMQPTNNITKLSIMYGSVSSPLAHLLVDYRNMRHAQIRQSFADAYNLQAKFVCSYTPATKSSAFDGEGGTGKIVTGPVNDGLHDPAEWLSQNRDPISSDNRLPSDMDANAYVRDAITEHLVGKKPAEHVPLVYTLPKNTSLEAQQKLEGIVNIPQLQVVFHFPTHAFVHAKQF